MQSVFDKIDTHERTYLGFNPFLWMRNIRMWRLYFSLLVVGAASFWIVFGWDSTWSQILPFVDNFIPLLQGKVSFASLWAESKALYGVGNHWSAPVIYGSTFVLLSRYLETVGIKKSYNFCVTTLFSLMNIGVFELLWNSFYAVFQNQIWTITFKWKQISNLSCYVAFTLLGLLVMLYVVTGNHSLNFGRTTKVLFLLSVFTWVLWVNYPFPVGRLSVETSTGTWVNTDNFPQTYYAIDLTPDDNLAIGDPFYVRNDLIHLVNNLAKVFTTGFLLSLCMVRENG